MCTVCERFVFKADLEAGKMSNCKDFGGWMTKSISKTAALVGCSHLAVVSVYNEWSK